MKKFSENLIIWISFLGAMSLEKVVGFVIYWVLFPWILFKYGTINGAVGLFIFQFMSSVIFIIVYDKIGKDLFKIKAVKQRCLDLLVWVKLKLGWNREVVWLRKFSWVVEFFLFSWQLLPPFALLCLRKVDRMPQINFWDIKVLSASSLFSTVFWTFVNKGILRHIWGIFNQ